MSKINLWNTEFKLTIFALLFLLLFKMFYIKDFIIILKTTFFDLFFFSIIFILFNYYKSIYLKITFYLFYIITFLSSSFYYFYYFDLSYRGNLLKIVSFDFVLIVLKDYLTFNTIFVIVFSFLLIFLSSKFLYKSFKFLISKKMIIYFYSSIFLIFIIMIFLLKIFTHPYISFFHEYQRPVPSIDLDKNYFFDENIFIYNKTQKEYFIKESNYKNIIVFLGEEWMFSDFLLESTLLSQNNFFEKTKNKSHYYNNYYTTNQDSRTSIYSMLSGYFIPFESYLGGDVFPKYLEVIENKKNVVEQLNLNQVSTHFLVSSIEVPDVSYPFPWKKINTLDPEIYNSGKYYCPKIFANETACEDLSVIDDFKRIIDEEESFFVFKEFIYGHSYRHIRDLKISRTQYYHDYILEIYNYLDEKNILDDTLIIITADHGSRAYYNMKYISGYHIPFIVIANDLEFKKDFRLFSHLDFKDILYKYLYNINNIQENKLIITIGATNSDLIGFKTKEDNFSIINVLNKKIINYNKDFEKVKETSQEVFSFYKYMIENYK